MARRERSLVLQFGIIGDGDLRLDPPPADLLPPGQSTLVPSPTTRAKNLELYDSLARVRPGNRNFGGTAPDIKPVNGLFFAVFDNGSSEFLRCDRATVYRYDGTNWASINHGVDVPSGADADVWTFALVRRAGVVTPKNEIHFCNGVDEVFQFRPGMATYVTVASSVFTGARVLLGHLGRGLAFNVKDSSGNRRTQRVMFSVSGDATDYAGTGSGFVDLDDDPYPIIGAAIVGGRVCVYKGNEFGGSIVVGTPLGIVGTPYRWDTIPGVGPLYGRTVRSLPGDVVFFVGRDGIYLHDGARTTVNIAPAASRTLLDSSNKGAWYGGHAKYNPTTEQIIFGIPAGTNSFPTEFYTIHLPSRRMSGGPWTFLPQPIIPSMEFFSVGTALIWGDAPYPAASPPAIPAVTWDTLPYPSWDSIGGAAGEPSFVIGTSTGLTLDDNAGTEVRDFSVLSIPWQWVSPAFIPRGQTIDLGSGRVRVLGDTDVLTCREVTIRAEDQGTLWVPTVEVSTDGQNWTNIVPAGSSLGGGTAGKIISATFTCEIPGTYFQWRISGSTAAARLHAVLVELTWSGDSRAG